MPICSPPQGRSTGAVRRPELAGVARQLVHPAEDAAEGHVLAEGHQMALVVARHLLPRRETRKAEL